MEIEKFLDRTHRQCAPKPRSALSLLHTTTDYMNGTEQQSQDQNNIQRYLPTGLSLLDQALSGGIRVGTVTELVGRAGVGKTQLAFQLCVMAAKHNVGTMYIDTEKKLNLQRLREMSRQRFIAQQEESNYAYENAMQQQQSATQPPHLNYKSPAQVFANLTVQTPSSTEELFSVLEDKTEMEILQRNQQPGHYPVRLLIVDSIAAPLKRDFGSDSAPQRAAAVFSIAQTLKRLADQLQLAIVVINQVGVSETGSSGGVAEAAPVGFREHFRPDVSVRAALGTSWHHCVSTRLLMEHHVDPHRLQDEEWTSHKQIPRVQDHIKNYDRASEVRRLSVVKSNIVAFSSMEFEVAAMGIVEVPKAITRLQEAEYQ